MKRWTLFLLGGMAATAAQAQAPELDAWIQNTTGILGRHYITGTNVPVNDTAHANVQLVRYSTSNVYINASGIPAYIIGPYQDGNPAQGTNRNYLFRIPRTPQQNTGTLTTPGLGHIGVWKNGVPIYNYADARSYNNQNVWHQNAVHFELAGFDCSKGHPSPVMGGPGPVTAGSYHHHQSPSTYATASVVLSTVCDDYPSDGLYVPDSTQHSPLLGYAFDGYPVYGAYAYANSDGTGGIKRMESSFRTRIITDRTTLADGTVLNASQYGPAIATTPLGAYKEDFEFVSGLGDLDVHNGRFAVTPEYPQGTYAYYATIDADGNSAYPYVIGETYYGVVATDNFASGGNPTGVTISEPVTIYTGATALDPAIAEIAMDVTVYPNPATEYLQVQIRSAIQANVDLSLTNLMGQVVATESIRSGSTLSRIPVQNLPAGTYFLTARVEDYTASWCVRVMH